MDWNAGNNKILGTKEQGNTENYLTREQTRKGQLGAKEVPKQAYKEKSY